MVLDHAIDKVRDYFDFSYTELLKEWKSGQYKKLSDCPSYAECKAYIDAIHVMEKYLYGKAQTMPVRTMIQCDC